MGTKTISIDDDAYNRLKNEKIGNESFSDVVKRLTLPIQEKSLLEFAGVWNLSVEEEKILKKKIKELGRDFDDMLR
ncbi:MAG: antitoxin VapB family protein [Candidatus Kariarchaeaceae archaeon]|jgi:predicted CopG family antitoxin